MTKERLYEEHSEYLGKNEEEGCKIDCGKGWYSIIHDICENLGAIKTPENVSIKIDSITHKYGVMRVNFARTGDNEIDLKLANVAYGCARKSELKCEVCGKAATPSSKGKKSRTLCSEHLTVED